ncbi:hypothetical protein AU193_22470 [Mycobacterium sp. GA-1285]|uniref:type VII secretion target n=1 Tax=Mycobacterium sp. GA-1285 TaxID=1772282 RepID=UPI00074AFC20|nr:type VII secretion target [Mycobacterium sp. GA-1285]KUI16949.1 hypothetical protein AU193_22470 [Mycobacterium sp. GA-1285]
MHADTDAVRVLAATASAHADELGAIAATLAALPISATGLGPVAQPFLAALADAVADEARVVASLRDDASASGGAAYRAALAYDDADDRAGARVLGV